MLQIINIHIQTHAHTQKMTVDTGFTPFTKINSKHIIDLNVKCKSNKHLQDNIQGNLGANKIMMKHHYVFIK